MENNNFISMELPPVTKEEFEREFRFIMQFVEAGYLDIDEVKKSDYSTLLSEYFGKNLPFKVFHFDRVFYRTNNSS